MQDVLLTEIDSLMIEDVKKTFESAAVPIRGKLEKALAKEIYKRNKDHLKFKKELLGG